MIFGLHKSWVVMVSLGASPLPPSWKTGGNSWRARTPSSRQQRGCDGNGCHTATGDRRRGKHRAMVSMCRLMKDYRNAISDYGGGDGDFTVDNKEVLHAVVTGANRGLGFAIADEMVSLGHRTVLACRDKNEGDAALERIRSHWPRQLAELASVHQLDVASADSIRTFQKNCVEGQLGGRVDILFNNAAVCFEGRDSAVVDHTLAVNVFGAVDVMKACLPAMCGHEATVVWVSSGDGELCFLGSKWQGILREASTVEEVISYLTDLQDVAKTEKWQHQQEEIAFGPTPIYSLSKAAANAVVRTLAPSLQDSSGGGVRLVAVCPGDVLTRMFSMTEATTAAFGTGADEEHSRPLLPEEAARVVTDVALRSFDFPCGRFYRNGKEIGW